MTIKDELKGLMDFYLGTSSEFLLNKELSKIGINNIESLDDKQKRIVVSSIMTDIIYPVVSKAQLFVIRTKLCQIVHLDESVMH